MASWTSRPSETIARAALPARRGLASRGLPSASAGSVSLVRSAVCAKVVEGLRIGTGDREGRGYRRHVGNLARFPSEDPHRLVATGGLLHEDVQGETTPYSRQVESDVHPRYGGQPTTMGRRLPNVDGVQMTYPVEEVGSVSGPVEITLIIDAVGYILVRRLLREPAEAKRMLLPCPRRCAATAGSRGPRAATTHPTRCPPRRTSSGDERRA